MSGVDIRTIVFANLEAAHANGYFEPGEQFDNAEAEDVAEDMSLYADDCIAIAPEELLPFIKEWMEQREKLK